MAVISLDAIRAALNEAVVPLDHAYVPEDRQISSKETVKYHTKQEDASFLYALDTFSGELLGYIEYVQTPNSVYVNWVVSTGVVRGVGKQLLQHICDKYTAQPIHSTISLRPHSDPNWLAAARMNLHIDCGFRVSSQNVCAEENLKVEILFHMVRLPCITTA